MSDSSASQKPGTSKHVVIALVVVLILGITIALCTFAVLNTNRRQHIPAKISFALTDPLAQKLASITDRIEILAVGTLNKGKYQVKDVPVTLTQPITFKLALTVPLNRTHNIDMAQISGALDTSEEILVSGLPMPKHVEVHKGVASADVNFAHALTAILLAGIEGSDLPDQESSEKIFDRINVKSAKWFITPGSTLDLTSTRFKFGADSALTLTDLNCDKEFNFAGVSELNINLDDVYFADKTTSFSAKKAVIQALLDIKRFDDDVTVGSHKDNKPTIELDDVNATKGSAVIKSNKIISTFLKCDGTSKLDNTKIEGECGGTLSWVGLSLVRKRTNGELSFASTQPVNIAFDISKKENELKLSTENTERIPIGKSSFTIKKPKSNLTLFMNQAELGRLALFSTEGIDLEIAPSEIELEKVTYASAKRELTFTTPSGKVKLVAPISLSASATSQPGQIPVHFDAAGLTMTGGKNPFVMQGLSGDASFIIGDHSVGLVSSLKADKAIIGKTGQFQPTVTVKQFQLGNVNDHMVLKISGLTALMPQEEFTDVIKSKFADSHEFKLNKTLFADRKWRYKDLVLDTVTISNTLLTNFNYTNTDVTFDGDTDVLASGTVQRYGLGFIGEKGWATHPWSATGRINGEGDLGFKFQPGPTLTDSILHCQLKAQFPVPKNLSVDWSKVAGDILGKAEQGMIAGAIHHSDHYKDGIKVHKDFDVKPFRHVGPPVGAASIKDVKITSTGDQIKIDCNAELNL